MPEQPPPPLPKPQHRGNQCNMQDALQKISLSKPPVSQGTYRTLYMMDYKPYADQSPTPIMDQAETLKLEAQLKAKEFARPVESVPMKYAEDAECREVQPPYPMRMQRSQEAPPSFHQVQEDQRKYFNTENYPPSCYPPVEPTATQKKEAWSPTPHREAIAMPDEADAPRVKLEQGQNWDNYHQFLLETRRASETQVHEIKKMHLGSSVFQEDFIVPSDTSTYQRDYKNWPRVRSGFCRAHRNFSNFIFEDGYYNENPWMSEYMDNYNIFIRKLHWKSRNPVSSFCSALKPIPHGIPSQTPIAVNTAL